MLGHAVRTYFHWRFLCTHPAPPDSAEQRTLRIKARLAPDHFVRAFTDTVIREIRPRRRLQVTETIRDHDGGRSWVTNTALEGELAPSTCKVKLTPPAPCSCSSEAALKPHGHRARRCAYTVSHELWYVYHPTSETHALSPARYRRRAFEQKDSRVEVSACTPSHAVADFASSVDGGCCPGGDVLVLSNRERKGGGCRRRQWKVT